MWNCVVRKKVTTVSVEYALPSSTMKIAVVCPSERVVTLCRITPRLIAEDRNVKQSLPRDLDSSILMKHWTMIKAVCTSPLPVERIWIRRQTFRNSHLLGTLLWGNFAVFVNVLDTFLLQNNYLALGVLRPYLSYWGPRLVTKRLWCKWDAGWSLLHGIPEGVLRGNKEMWVTTPRSLV
jgi:hypothetical protein